MYWVTPILKILSLSRDCEGNCADKAYKMEDVQKYRSRRTTRNMRVDKAGSGTGTVWRMALFTLGKIGKMGTVLPFEVARPF